MKFHHIGIACEDIAKGTAFVEGVYGIQSKSEVIFDPKQNALLCMLYTHDNSSIELISGPQVAGLVKKRIALYHTCWEVENLESAIQSFCENGATLISEPKEAILFDNRRVAFLISDLGIVELLEEQKKR